MESMKEIHRLVNATNASVNAEILEELTQREAISSAYDEQERLLAKEVGEALFVPVPEYVAICNQLDEESVGISYIGAAAHGFGVELADGKTKYFFCTNNLDDDKFYGYIVLSPLGYVESGGNHIEQSQLDLVLERLDKTNPKLDKYGNYWTKLKELKQVIDDAHNPENAIIPPTHGALELVQKQRHELPAIGTPFTRERQSRRNHSLKTIGKAASTLFDAAGEYANEELGGGAFIFEEFKHHSPQTKIIARAEVTRKRGHVQSIQLARLLSGGIEISSSELGNDAFRDAYKDLQLLPTTRRQTVLEQARTYGRLDPIIAIVKAVDIAKERQDSTAQNLWT